VIAATGIARMSHNPKKQNDIHEFKVKLTKASD